MLEIVVLISEAFEPFSDDPYLLVFLPIILILSLLLGVIVILGFLITSPISLPLFWLGFDLAGGVVSVIGMIMAYFIIIPYVSE